MADNPAPLNRQQEPTKLTNKIVTEVVSVASSFRSFAVKQLADMAEKKISPNDARKNLHAYFKDLSQEDQIELYRDKARKILLELQNYGSVLFGELPVVLSQVNLSQGGEVNG